MSQLGSDERPARLPGRMHLVAAVVLLIVLFVLVGVLLVSSVGRVAF